MKLLRWFGGVLLGLGTALFVFVLTIFVTMALWPWTANLDDGITLANVEAIDAVIAYFAALPLLPKLIMLGGHATAALVGGFVAALAARNFWLMGIGLGTMLTVLASIYALGVPTSLWLNIANVAVILPATLLGTRIGSRIEA